MKNCHICKIDIPEEEPRNVVVINYGNGEIHGHMVICRDKECETKALISPCFICRKKGSLKYSMRCSLGYGENHKPLMILNFPGCSLKCAQTIQPKMREYTTGFMPEGYQNKIENFRMCKFCCKRGKGLKSCGSCGITWYCSEKCQKSDWKRHKEVCKQKTTKPAISKIERTDQNILSTLEELTKIKEETLEELAKIKEETLEELAKIKEETLEKSSKLKKVEPNKFCNTPFFLNSSDEEEYYLDVD